jgi:DNA-binding NtrC family response regulator
MSAKAKILVVDDRPEDCETISDAILQTKDNQIEVETAKTGRAALDLAKEKIFDVALLDILMADLSGLEVLKSLKKISPETLVIMITANATLESAVASLNLGAFAYLTKPLNLAETIVKIDKALEIRRIETELKQKINALEENNHKVVARELRLIELEKEIAALEQETKGKV